MQAALWARPARWPAHTGPEQLRGPARARLQCRPTVSLAVFTSRSPRIVGTVQLGGHSHPPLGLRLQSQGTEQPPQRHKPWRQVWHEEGPFGSGYPQWRGGAPRSVVTRPLRPLEQPSGPPARVDRGWVRGGRPGGVWQEWGACPGCPRPASFLGSCPQGMAALGSVLSTKQRQPRRASRRRWCAGIEDLHLSSLQGA